jgi:aconitate hydratase
VGQLLCLHLNLLRVELSKLLPNVTVNGCHAGLGALNTLLDLDGVTAQTLKLDGTETYDVIGLDASIKPQQDLVLRITRKDGAVENVSVRCRIDTPIEIDYYQHGGILPYVLRQIVARN